MTGREFIIDSLALIRPTIHRRNGRATRIGSINRVQIKVPGTAFPRAILYSLFVPLRLLRHTMGDNIWRFPTPLIFMPSVDENKHFWSNYDWSREGQEWSYAWGGSRFVWVRTVLPRILKFVPTGHILEIGCGHGRFTRYLVELCEQLTGVDLAEPCIEFCTEKFPKGRFFLSDGESLPDSGPVDFAFSFDSLVHAELDVLEGYLRGLATRFSGDGVAFIHHSNMASLGDVEPVHMRGRTVSALGFRRLCHDTGLKCISQETLVWGWQGVMSDCISVVVRPGGKFDHPFTFRENADFMNEVFASKEIADFYYHTDPDKYDE